MPVLDAFAQSIHDASASVGNGPQVIIRRTKPITAWVFGIPLEIRKDRMDVDNVRIRPGAVVEACQRNRQFPVKWRQGDRFALAEGAVVAAMQRSDEAVRAGKIDGEFSGRRAERSDQGKE